MKKCLFALIVIALSVACAKEKDFNTVEEKTVDNKTENTAQAGEMVTISATLPEDLLTKVTFEPTITGGKPTAMALAWKEGDKIRIFDHSNHTLYEDFTLDPACDGKTKGFFSGETTKISAATAFDVEIVNEAVVIGSQTQKEDGNTEHLKYYAPIENIADYSSLTFTNISNILAITAKMPSTGVAAAIKTVDITASENIFGSGNTLTITLTNKGDAGDDGILHLFANLPQENKAIAAGTSLVVHFNAPETAHTVYTRFIELGASTFTAGKLNTININASQSGTHAGLTSCDGTTAEKAYLIGDKYQLAAIADELAADATRYFKMIDDVDMSGVSWSYLNASSPYNKVIDFDGNGKTIRNLGGSMFYVFKGAVRNLTLDSPSVTAGTHKGVFATYIQGTNNTLTNVKIQNVASFEGSSGNCGGMVGRINNGADGYPTATFDGCVVSNVPVNSGGTSAGGFIGSVEAKVVMNNCTYTGANVTNTSTTSDKGYAGGLIGFASAEVSITSSKVVNAKIAGYDAIGGMIGNINSGGFGNLTSCSVKADVNGRNYIGGFIGRERIASGVTIAISKCSFESYEDGVSGTNQYVGGIIGNQYGSGTVTIENSYVNSPVIATDAWAGGISGNHYNGTLTIGRCYVMGSVSAKYGAGGIVGQVRVANLTINPCAVYVSSISATATDSDPHESSGTIVAYGYNVNVTIARNCWYDQTLSFTECPGNAGSPSTWTPAKQGGLTNAKISGGTPHSKIYPYWGRNTNPSDYPLNKMCKDILECSSDIWNLDVNPPILK